MKSSSHWPQLKKACEQQERPSTAKKKERKEGRKEEIYSLISFGVLKPQIQVLAGLAPSENSETEHTTILLF